MKCNEIRVPTDYSFPSGYVIKGGFFWDNWDNLKDKFIHDECYYICHNDIYRHPGFPNCIGSFLLAPNNKKEPFLAIKQPPHNWLNEEAPQSQIYNPLAPNNEPELYLKFASLSDKNENGEDIVHENKVLDFINKFGGPIEFVDGYEEIHLSLKDEQDKRIWYAPFSKIREEIMSFARTLKYYQENIKTNGELEYDSWLYLRNILNFRLRNVHPELIWGNQKAIPIYRDGKWAILIPRLKQADCKSGWAYYGLLEAVYLQLYQRIVTPNKFGFGICENPSCKHIFEKHSSVQKYCSPSCRNVHHVTKSRAKHKIKEGKNE